MLLGYAAATLQRHISPTAKQNYGALVPMPFAIRDTLLQNLFLHWHRHPPAQWKIKTEDLQPSSFLESQIQKP
ncbi:hypothetical protein D3C81_1411410 [compost metagenome]